MSFRLPNELPLLTQNLPGTGGAVGGPDDFVVEEIPAYPTSGSGEHVFAWIEKRSMSTSEVVQRMAQALAVRSQDVGYAGMKDKHGVTRQWLSFLGTTPEKVGALEVPGLTVLQVTRHENKLRTGHLRGNRFVITLRDLTGGAEDAACAENAASAARRIFDKLSERGMPNYYGMQRFGVRGDNADFGLKLLNKEARPPRDKRKYRLIVSALQSQIYNEIVAQRISDNALQCVYDGDVLQRSDSGACFVSEDQQTDQQRYDNKEVLLTGPICGPRMLRPRESSEARQYEDAVLSRFDIDPAQFSVFGKIARGARRPLTVPIDDAQCEALPEEKALRLRFALPAGSYATTLLREVTKLFSGHVPYPLPEISK